MNPGDARLERVADLLVADGISGARVSVAGKDGDIAVIEGVEARHLARLAPAIRALGFRFVAVDLTDVPA